MKAKGPQLLLLSNDTSDRWTTQFIEYMFSVKDLILKCININLLWNIYYVSQFNLDTCYLETEFVQARKQRERITDDFCFPFLFKNSS
jgi:hypothetical protein